MAKASVPPTPLLVLAGAAIAVNAIPGLGSPPERVVQDVVTVALVVILFNGGTDIGVRRFRSAVVPVLSLGVAGTFLTAAGAAVFAHYALGLDWYVATLVATAIAPTDPAVVFSVLGRHEILGRSGTILEGESGANDPVGIALMRSLVAAGALSAHSTGRVGLTFALQMVVGVAVGGGGGVALTWLTRRSPGVWWYRLGTLVGVALVYVIATLALGSGFLAVFVAGIVIGDEDVPFKQRVERFQSLLASASEVVAFVVLGATIDLAVLSRRDVLLPGLALAAMVAFVIRPVFGWLILLPARLRANETAFVLFAGLKGAVPLLLGESLLASSVAHASRYYGIVVVVVLFSVLVQGTLTPLAAKVLRLPMRPITER
ncbi:MAG TPA: cation:proton antiporter [Jatrophihabitantaceae bacterium]